MNPNPLFLSLAVVLGAAAGLLETILVLTTGIMPVAEVALNVALLPAAFFAVAAGWTFLRRLPLLNRISEEFVLVLVSILVFALRGCLRNCGEGAAWRLGVPVGIVLASLAALALLPRPRGVSGHSAFMLVALFAMTLTALDFALRDGVRVEFEVFAKVLISMAVAAGLSAAVVRWGWLANLLWTLVLVLTSVLWARLEVRPFGIEPVVNSGKGSLEPSGKTRPNVVLVVMDTVRADHLSLYGYPRKTSPNLDAIANESLVFEHAVASGNYSLPSHASLFTGLLPSEHGAHQQSTDMATRTGQGRGDDYGVAAEVRTMAEKLLASGYATGALSGNHGYLAAWTGLRRGFTAFNDRARRRLRYYPFSFPLQRRLFKAIHQETQEWEAPSITRAGLFFATSSSAPFLLFLNYFDAHIPYLTREGHLFRGDGIGSDAPPIPAYDSEIGYQDAALGELLGGLRRAGLLDRTIVVITADHGEFFGEHGLRQHQTGGYEPVLHIPLLIRYPGRLPPERVSRPFGLHEVHRLIFDLLEDRPIDWAYTETDEPRVLAQAWGRVADTDRPGSFGLNPQANIVYSGSYKLIDRVEGDDELYDLDTDPGEQHNLLIDASPELLSLTAQMRTAVTNLPPPRRGTDPNVTAADLDALRGLGYLSLKKPGRK